jgi:hypothetical protein
MAWVEKFAALTALTHSEQAQWWLNGFWEEGAKDYAEDMWRITHSFIELQIDGPVLYGSKKQQFEEGCDLDEHKSHRILEKLGETMTVVALRKRLKELDIDNNKKMAISEYLIDKYQKTPQQLVSSPQGQVDPEALAAAQEACDNASAAMDDAAEAADQASKTLEASIKAAAEASTAKDAAEAALADAQTAEQAVKKAEAELQATVDEIAGLEKTKADKIAKFQAIIDDASASGVKKGKATQEKAALEGEDELPLRKAKITQNAALKRVQKVRKAAEEKTALADEAAQAATNAKTAADKASAEADQAKTTADEAAKLAETAMSDAQEALDKLKSAGTGAPQGKLWWMERIMKEKKKFSR